jgi:hypothetical protein
MKADWITELVLRWVRYYTRNLPASVARRRVEEIDADLHDHIAHGRENGLSDQRIALGIASRMVRGLAADAAWRARQARRAGQTSTKERMVAKKRRTVYHSAMRVALGVGVVLSVPLVAMLFTDEVDWTPADFVAAGALLVGIGVALELAVRRMANLATAVGFAIFGLVVAVLGNADDAPGLVLLGILLTGSGCLLGVRTVQHSR